MENIRMKYILSVVSLLLVIVLVVLAPYGYNYLNDNIREGQTHNDGTFSYSEGKIATEYDEVRILLEKSSPVWINENLGTVTAEMYEEIYSAMASLFEIIIKDEHIENMVGAVLHVSDTNYCYYHKVSGLVGNEPLTVNLMSVYFINSYDNATATLSFIYNRDNKKVYEFRIDLGYEEAIDEFESDDYSLQKEYMEYLGCSSGIFSGGVYSAPSYLHMCAFPGAYLKDTFSYKEIDTDA